MHWDLNTYDKSTLQMRRPLDESRVRKLYTIADEACKAVISKGENSLLSKYEDVFRALNEGGVYNPEEVMFEYAEFGNTTNGRVGYTNGLCIHASNALYGKTLPLQLIILPFIFLLPMMIPVGMLQWAITVLMRLVTILLCLMAL